MKKQLITVIALAISILGYSQEPYQAPNILPPSPTAAELGKYGLIPVGMATGTPNVDIPIYVYRTTNLQVPISLTYSSNGVKVDQTASWVGLNFSLNSGGVITRIVRDDPDEDNIIGNVNFQYPYNFNSNNVDALLYLDAANNDGFDTEPDLFSFNFQGYTGKFIFDRNGTPLIMPHQNLIIQRIIDPTSAGLGNFLVMTPDGIQYTFGAVETSKSYQFTGCGKNYDGPSESSWYLTEIKHPAGDVITFEYESSNYFYAASISQTARSLRSAEICPGETSPSFGTTVQTCLSKILVNVVRLDRIYASSPMFGSIEFVSTQDRTDLDDYRLNTILIKDANETVKAFDFSYVFSSSTAFSNQYTAEDLKHRMFLIALTEKDRSGKSVRAHSFEYEDINGLPPRLSYAQDHWGFFNKANNSHLIPKDILIKDTFGRYLFNDIGGDREPNSDVSKKGILTKIVYPTGGHTSFEYQPNEYWGDKTVYPAKIPLELRASVAVDGPLTVTDSKSMTIPFQQTIYFGFSASQRPGYIADPIHDKGIIIVRDVTLGNIVVLNKTVDVAESAPGYLDLYEDHEYSFSLTASGEGVDADFSFNYYATDPQIVQDNIEVGGVRVSKIVNYDPATAKNEEINYHYAKHDLLAQSSGKIGSPPQYYSENLNKIPCGIQCAMSELTYGVLSSNSQNTLFTPSSNNIYYEYVTVSRGASFSNGVEEHQFIINFDYAGQQVWGRNLIKNAPLTNFGWNNGLEKYSRIYKTSGAELKLIKETFLDYTTDTRNQLEVKALVVRKNYDPSCYSDLVVDCDDSNINLVYTIFTCVTQHNHFYVINGKSFFGFGDSRSRCIASGNSNQEVTYANHPCFGHAAGTTATRPRELDHVDAIEYKNIAYWFYLKRKIETNYENNVETLSTVTEYVYDNPIHSQLSREQAIRSDGKETETVIKYPDDYDLVGNISTLKQKHIISVPIKKESSVDGKQIGGIVTLYNDFGQPKEVYSYENASLNPPITHSSTQLVPPFDYKLKLEYDYNETSHVVKEVKLFNSPKKSYLWGYDNTLPVAEALNASSNQVLFLSFEDAGGTSENGATKARTGRKYWNSGAYNFTTNANFNPGASGLLMSYWYLSGSEWIFSGIVDFNNLINAGSGLDDIRIFPKSSQMVTYTYDPLMGITSVTDANNVTTYYDYDDLGRLQMIKDSDQNIVKRYKYHYQNEQ